MRAKEGAQYWNNLAEAQAEIEKLRAALERIDGEASQGAPNSLIEEIAQQALNGGDDG